MTVILKSFLDAEGRLTVNTDGYARMERSYDDAGNVVREDYYDQTLSPAANKSGVVSVQREYDENKRVISSVSIASGGTATIYLYFQELFQRIGAQWDYSASDPYNNDSWSIDFTRNGATLIGGDIYAKKGIDGWIKRST